MLLSGKKIVLGVTGSIAAYKAAVLLRLLAKNGAEVKVVMTATAKAFISPLTMATLAKHPVLVDFFNPENGEWNSHVKLGLWADLLLIAPATANTIGKMANGIADNLLLTAYFSAKCPTAIAPAMDLDMYNHPVNQQNIQKLKQLGVHIFEATSGELASGLEGKGRMEEPEVIVQRVVALLGEPKELTGKIFLVTAGPTYENIDAVRFVGNYSSGKMGYAIAEELAERGASVQLISGPVSIVAPKNPNVAVRRVTSAEEMYEAATEFFPYADGAILSAAVADFTPENRIDGKLKRNGEALSVNLKPTKDIAAELGRMKNGNQYLVGFALEAANELDNARRKLTDKNLDFIVLNSMNDAGAGFNVDTNKVCILGKDGSMQNFELKSKPEVAKDVVNKLVQVVGSCR
ncbi:MAG: bifunctional phosphopantothenoylcysteine decarboxylase/phosphopantothenate--cysteine ligase CoaBC [Prevotellaceae bacterium]|jgi:phosphopantothenoylcysteine decarboxylase/phosphopantothenate--cysteine ligase|nr:bifunctional phosphopantothenoylcysteine decarboxylase/phosphopantothenate--cysteine ligase CoaBC [Prevotellaceae bacterium]